MRRLSPHGLSAGLTLLTVLLAGCGSVRAGGSSPGGPASPASSASQSSQSPQARAKADAAAILAAFVPPPGASRLGSAPTGGGGVLKKQVFQAATPNLVDDADWWRVPGLSRQGVLDWEKAHLPSRFTVGGTGGPVGVNPAIEQWWTLPDITGVLANRWLMLTAFNDGGGSYLRVDADVAWIPARPAWSMLPAAGIRAVVATAEPSTSDKRKPPAPVTVTDPSQVRKLVDLINGLPMPLPLSIITCPPLEGGTLRLAFLERPGGPVVAVATVSDNDCPDVGVSVGSQQVSLGLLSGTTQQALALSGLNWTFYQQPM